MYKTFMLVRRFLLGLFESETPSDPLSGMSPRELADLPVHHPRREQCLNP